MADSIGLTFFHGATPSRSLTVHWMLEEVGEPYELLLVDFLKEENRAPEYLAINPLGQVPAVLHDGALITETAAICCYLADAFPKANLAVPIGSSLRGPYLRWIFFATTCLEPLILEKIYDRSPLEFSMTGWLNPTNVLNVLAEAVKDRPFIVGDQFTAADLMVGSTLNWGMNIVGAMEPRAEFNEYCNRLEKRPARQRQLAKDSKQMSILGQ
jgi:glutathione S-transferase